MPLKVQGVIFINEDRTMDEREEEDKISHSISELADALREPMLKSSMRILILMVLVTNKRLTFTQLLTLTGIGKGSLNNDLAKLEEGGLIRFENAFTLKGPRLFVTVTENGLKMYRKYISLIKDIDKKL